jgi:hypothetical protein
MNRDEGSAGVLSKFKMDNVLRDIAQFREGNNEDLIFSSGNHKYAQGMAGQGSQRWRLLDTRRFD